MVVFLMFVARSSSGPLNLCTLDNQRYDDQSKNEAIFSLPLNFKNAASCYSSQRFQYCCLKHILMFREGGEGLCAACGLMP